MNKTKLKLTQKVNWWLSEGRRVGGLGERTEEVKNPVTNTAVTTCGARWVREILAGTLCKVYDCLTTMLYT